MKRLRGFGAWRGMRAGMALSAIKPIADLGEEADDEEARLASWSDRVGETRAGEALGVWRNRQRGQLGSGTLPELLVEAALSKRGVDYRAQVDLGWARPDFVVLRPGHAVVVEVYGDYWHSRPGAPTHDAQRRERLEGTTIFGLPVRAVIELWERDIYESEAIVARALDLDEFVVEGEVAGEAPLTYAQRIALTSGLWAHWRFNGGDLVTATDETGAHHATYRPASQAPASIVDGRKPGETARVSYSADGLAFLTAGVSVTNYTVEMWTRLPSLAASGALCTIGTSPNWTRVILAAGVEGWLLSVNGTPILEITGLTAWTHLAVVREGASAIVYRNGVRVGFSASVAVVATSADFVQVGGGAFTSGQQIDDAALFTRALSADEIWNHYQAG